MNPELYKEILDNLFDGVYFTDRHRRILYWNRGAERISGYAGKEVLGHFCSDNILRHIDNEGRPLCLGICPLAKTLKDGERREDEVFLHHKDGHRVPISVRIAPVRDASGTIIGAVEIFRDETNRRRIREELDELKELSLADSLTGLGNRRSVERQFERSAAELRLRGVPFGLLFLDIDHFKRINDTFGHEAGDHVLVAVSRTLHSALRSTDSLFRWGGEEFLVIAPRVDAAGLRKIAERMRRFVEVTPIPLGGEEVTLTLSIGGEMARKEDSLAALTQRADAMMYTAKNGGRNCSRFFWDACPPPKS